MRERLDKWIEDFKPQMIQEIIDLVGFESIHGRKEENKACLHHFLRRAQEMGFRTNQTKDDDVGIVEYGKGEETLGILVHLDVVDVGDLDKWTFGPFRGRVQEGFLYGRGTVDDKGAAVMCLYAMKALAKQVPEERLTRKIQLIVGTSEEGHWTDMEHFKEQFPAPTFGFSPDGEFPIYNIEKGYADLVFRFPHDETREPKITSLIAGDSPNTIPSKALLQLENGRVYLAEGVSSHSSTPESADNAILRLCKTLCREMEDPYDFAKFLTDHLTQDGLPIDIALDDGTNQWNGEYVGSTTATPTVLFIENEEVFLNLNIRHKVGTKENDIIKAFAPFADQYRYTVSIREYLDPMIVSRDLPFLKVMNQVHEEYGLEGGFEVAAGTSYAKSMDRFVSWGPIPLSDPACAHIEDERLSVETMLLATKMYARYLSLMTI